MRLNIKSISQRDPKWKDIKLGTSDVTIGTGGCLLVCCAMVAQYYGHDIDPASLNNLFIEAESYSDGNLYKWYEGLSKVYSDIKVTKYEPTPKNLTASQLRVIDDELEAGRPVIIEVDFKPATVSQADGGLDKKTLWQLYF